jgi:hypothetical protein
MNMRFVSAWVAAVIAAGLGATPFFTSLAAPGPIDVSVSVNWISPPAQISPNFLGVSLSANNAGNGLVTPLTGFANGAVASTSQLQARIMRFPDDNSQSYHWRQAFSRGQLGTDDLWFFANQSDIGQMMVTVNMVSGDTDEAAQWVEYANGAASTPRGSERASKSVAPYNITYWMLGEDIRDHPEKFSTAGVSMAGKYVVAALQNASAMKNVSASIQIGLWIDEGGTLERDAWNSDLIAALKASDPGQLDLSARRLIDFLAVRVRVDVPNRPLTDSALFPTLYPYAVARTEEIVTRAEQVSQGLRQNLPVAVYRFGIDFPSEGWNQDKADSMGASIAVSGMLNAMARHDQGKLFTAIYYGLNCKGFNAVLKVPDTRLFDVSPADRFALNPVGEVLSTYGQYLDGLSLPFEFDTSGPAYYKSPALPPLNSSQAVPIVSVAAALDEVDRQFVLFVGSRSLDANVVLHLTILTSPTRTLDGRVLAQVVTGDTVSADRFIGLSRVTSTGVESETPITMVEPGKYTLNLAVGANSYNTFVFTYT